MNQHFFKKRTRFSGLLVFILQAFNLGVKFSVTLSCGLHYYSSSRSPNPDLHLGIGMGFFWNL